MRALLFVSAAVLAASCASPPPEVAKAPAPGAVKIIALQNPGFEDKPAPGDNCPAGWGCTTHADPTSFRFTPLEVAPASGARSYCVESVGKEPWANLTQGLRDVAALRGTRVRLSLAVKLEGVAGQGVGPMIIAQGRSGETIATAQTLGKGEKAWQRIEVEMDVPQATTLLEVGMTFIGRGKACIDDARLEVLPAGPV